MNINELSQIDIAQDIAMWAHAGQKRKFSGKPYYIHPFRVYQLAKKFSLPMTSQVVAILHDTYEDSRNKKYTIGEIQKRLGNKVVSLVLLLSHDRGVHYNRYLLDLAKASKDAFNVKLLDMINNSLDSPSQKQLAKYKNSIEYLIKNDIQIPLKIKPVLFKILKIGDK